MTIFVKQKDGNVVSSVQHLGTQFSEFIKHHAEIIKTAEGREYAALPFIFERIDNSEVFIVRDFDTDYIKKDFVEEIRKSFNKKE